VQGGELRRLYWHALLHVSNKHLAVNMVSLCNAGTCLEQEEGIFRFSLLIVELWVTSSLLYCGTMWGANRIAPRSPAAVKLYRQTYFVGFSGIIQALFTGN
jgi:membrane associated rhomboid family serine protease